MTPTPDISCPTLAVGGFHVELHGWGPGLAAVGLSEAENPDAVYLSPLRDEAGRRWESDVQPLVTITLDLPKVEVDPAQRTKRLRKSHVGF
jgi:hypothetical protein